MRRQPLAARVWGGLYRTWYPPDSQRRRAKRRSAKRERQRIRAELRSALAFCAVCGSIRELGADGSCLDAGACIADLDEMLSSHACGPECTGAELIVLLEAVDRRVTPEHIEERLRQVLDQAGHDTDPPGSSH